MHTPFAVPSYRLQQHTRHKSAEMVARHRGASNSPAIASLMHMAGRSPTATALPSPGLMRCVRRDRARNGWNVTSSYAAGITEAFGAGD
jgi:hypothetical protein